MKVKLTDVAKHAGVAVGTVSHVLNHPERVSPAVREQVRASIKELGYARNINASSLRSGINRVVSMVVVDISDPYFSLVAAHVEWVLAERGLMFTLSSTRANQDRQRDVANTIAAQGPRGIVLMPTSLDMSDAEKFRNRGIPVVLFDYPFPSPTFSSVAADDVDGVFQATTLLLDLGHRNLGFVNGPQWATQSGDRQAGFLKAVDEHPSRDSVTFRLVNAKKWTAAAGHTESESLMGAPDFRPTGIICGNDMLALGVLSQLTQAGYSVPDDVSVVGFDDLPMARELPVPLTTVHRSAEKMAEATVEVLLDEKQPQHRLVPVHLVVRESTGPVPE